MIIEWQTLLLTIPAGLALLVCCFLTGFAFIRLSHYRKGELPVVNSDLFFWCLVYGLFFIVSVYAIIVTRCKTSLLLVPFLVAALVQYGHGSLPDNKIVTGQPKKMVFFLTSCFLLYWLFFASHYFSFQEDTVNYIAGDTAFYGRAADYLNYKKQENVAMDFLNLSDRKVEPYHYGDLWIIALLYRLTGINAIVTTQVVIYPAFATIFVSGLAGYCQHLLGGKVRDFYIYSFSVFGVFVSGFIFLFPKSLLNTNIFSLSLAGYPKTLFVACILIAVLLSIKNLNRTHTLILITVGALLFITIAPAILIFIAVVLIGFLLVHRNMTVSLWGFILCALSLLYYFLFYWWNHIGSELGLSPSSFSFRTAINIVMGSLLQLFPLSPFLLLLFYSWIRERGNAHFSTKSVHVEFFYLALLFLAGFLSWSLLYPLTFDAVQFFSNLFVPLASISIVIILLYSLSVKMASVIPILLLIFSVAQNARSALSKNHISKEDLQLCSDFFKSGQEGMFASIQSALRFTSLFNKNTVVFQPLDFIDYLQIRYIDVSFNAPAIPVSPSSLYAAEERAMLQSAPFSLFIEKQVQQRSVEENAYLFVKEYDICYISVDPDTSLFQSLKPLVRDSIQLSSGWKIYSLAPPVE